MREKKRDEKHSCRYDWLRTCDLENETCTRLIPRTHIHKRAHLSLEIIYYTISRTHTHTQTQAHFTPISIPIQSHHQSFATAPFVSLLFTLDHRKKKQIRSYSLWLCSPFFKSLHLQNVLVKLITWLDGNAGYTRDLHMIGECLC